MEGSEKSNPLSGSLRSRGRKDDTMTRKEAMAMFENYVSQEALKKHTLAVEAGVRGYAEKYDQDVDKWSAAAILHDLDYEKYPEEHPLIAAKILREEQVEEEIIEAILGHGDHTGVSRESLLSKVLYASDELASFIVACALVRPSKSFEDLKLKSVKKKLKDKAFAKGVDREILKKGAAELEIDLEEHITNMIEFLRLRERELNNEGESLLE